MLQFSLGLIIGISLGVFIMCLMIIAGRGPEPPLEWHSQNQDNDDRRSPISSDEASGREKTA